jgi:LuxR family maltose regulon positive regulatory protein
MTLVKQGDLLTLLGWQRQFPAELMRGQVRVRLAIAWGMTLAMRADEAQALLEQVEQDTRAQPERPEQADVLWECQALRAVTLALSDDPTAALALAEACIARPSADPWNTNVLSNVLRFSRWRAGDVDGVYAAPWIPYSLEEDRRNVFSSVYRHAILGLLELDQARFDLAEREANEALRLAGHYVGKNSSAAAIGAPLLAELRYEQGRFEEAEGLLVERMPTIDAVVMLEGVRRGYVVLARIAAARSGFEHAYGLLAQAESLGYNRKWDRLVSGVLLERARLHLLEGRLAEASACVVRLQGLAAAHPVAAPCAQAEIHRDRDLARVELACAHSRWTEAVDILEGLHRDAEAARNARLMMQLKARLAVARMASNDTDGALRALRAALDIAAPSGACRSVLDAGPDIAPLLERFRASSRCTKTLEPCVERLQAACGGDAARRPDRACSPATSLSPRERDILVLIADGRSNKEVARSLGVTPETVKSHLKNIFEKLSVERRAQAVACARSLGLL